MRQVMLMIGTRKGAFLAFSDESRQQWRLEGPCFKGAEIHYVAAIPDAKATRGAAVYAAGASAWWGPGIQISTDLGSSWEEGTPVRFHEDRELSVERVWILKAAGDRILAGVDPGALFASTGDGDWQEVRALTDHPTRDAWQPGAGGMMVHSICVDPSNADRFYVGVSAAGTFLTEDGGISWAAKNAGVRADFLPDKFPAVGQCVHHMEMHPTDPRTLYQQNHCGVYRSDDGGQHWHDISDGLPSRFGFPLAVDPNDGDSIFVIPEESDEHRVTPGGAFCVYRSRDRGNHWEALTKGLPQQDAWVNVLRHGLCTDSFDHAAVYCGTQGGQVLIGRDGGDRWETLFGWLPPVYSVQAIVLD